MPTMTYLQAISDAMREEMRADERVFLMGEDIGVFGGAFKVTDGFIEEFGAERVMDTPLAEAGIVGTAVGAELVDEAVGDLERAAEGADVLAHEEHALVGAHLLAHGGGDRLQVGHRRHQAALPAARDANPL